MPSRFIAAVLVTAIACLSTGLQARPVVDMHLHYKWTQQELTTPDDALRRLRDSNIIAGVVIGTPAELALQLQSRDPQRIIAIYSPYREGGDWYRWAYDETTVARARTALESGQYHGIGELHLIGGFAPSLEKSAVLQGLLALAREYDVPVMIHTEYSRADFMLALCKSHPDVRIVWAHSGAILEPEAVDTVLVACPNVYGGLGARDPWRFVNNPTTAPDGELLPAWRRLLLQYPGRFMVGSDPVWPVDQLDRWDEPDRGWQELDRFWTFHRGWLAQLPDPVARRIACENALVLFGRDDLLAACRAR